MLDAWGAFRMMSVGMFVAVFVGVSVWMAVLVMVVFF